MKELEKLMSCDSNWDFNKSWIQFVSLFTLGAKKNSSFFQHGAMNKLLVYLWMSSFCVPNTDGEVF